MQHQQQSSLADISELSAEDASRLPASCLAEIQQDLAWAEADLKKRKEILTNALALKYGRTIPDIYRESGKDTGKVHMTDEGIGIEVEVSKRVDWDQAGLYSVFSEMPAETAKHYAKVSYKVDERKFNAAPPDIKAKLSACRTVRPGDPKITFETVVKD